MSRSHVYASLASKGKLTEREARKESVELLLEMICDASATTSLACALKEEKDGAVQGVLKTALDTVKKNVMSKNDTNFLDIHAFVRIPLPSALLV
jgi:hypothetical protein